MAVVSGITVYCRLVVASGIGIAVVSAPGSRSRITIALTSNVLSKRFVLNLGAANVVTELVAAHSASAIVAEDVGRFDETEADSVVHLCRCITIFSSGKCIGVEAAI